jgi:putative MFS transporter
LAPDIDAASTTTTAAAPSSAPGADDALAAASSLAFGAASAADEAPAVPLKRPASFLATFKKLWSGEHLRSTVVLWVLWLGINLGYYGFVLWTPSLLMTQGFDMVRSFEFTLLMCVAQLPGYLCAAVLIEKAGRKPALTVFLVGTALAAWLFGHASSELTIIFSGCLLYFFALGAWGCVYSYTPELYPTSVRGAGTGWAAACGRVGALVAPMILPVLYSIGGTENGYTGVFIILTGVFLVVAIVVGIFGRETKGTPLYTE